MAKLGDVNVLAYRVLKPYGHWQLGDVQLSRSETSMAQNVRRGVVERAPEFDHVIPLTASLEGDQMKVTAGKARKKSGDGQASV